MERLLGRLGKSKSLIDIEITIHTIELRIPDTKTLKISWERRKKCAETQEFIISNHCSSVTLQTSLFMSITLYSKNSEYLEKLAKLKLKQKVRNDWITITDLTLDLSQYIGKPLKNQDFFFSFDNHRCKVTLSLQSHSSNESEVYSIEKNIMDTREKFESILKQYNESQEEVELLKKEVETLSKSLEDTKNNRNENYLEAEQIRLKQEIEVLEDQLKKEQEKKLHLQEVAENIHKKVNEEREEEELNQMSGRLKDIIKRHTVFNK